MPYLHHLLVHFPIVLALAAAASSIAALHGNERWRWLGRIAAIAAAAAAVLAAATGLWSAGHVIEMGGNPALVARHRNLAIGATGVLAVSALLMRFSKRAAVGVAATLVAAAAVGVAADYGGDMLHPGLAPWSEAPHHHGPSLPTSPQCYGAAPSAGARRPTPVPSTASNAAPEPSALPKPVHDHSTHTH